MSAVEKPRDVHLRDAQLGGDLVLGSVAEEAQGEDGAVAEGKRSERAVEGEAVVLSTPGGSRPARGRRHQDPSPGERSLEGQSATGVLSDKATVPPNRHDHSWHMSGRPPTARAGPFGLTNRGVQDGARPGRLVRSVTTSWRSG